MHLGSSGLVQVSPSFWVSAVRSSGTRILVSPLPIDLPTTLPTTPTTTLQLPANWVCAPPLYPPKVVGRLVGPWGPNLPPTVLDDVLKQSKSVQQQVQATGSELGKRTAIIAELRKVMQAAWLSLRCCSSRLHSCPMRYVCARFVSGIRKDKVVCFW
jgi:hypothetical protein